MIKAVLFDLDGTLLNRDASLEKFINAQYERLKDKLGHIQQDLFKTRFIELDAHGYVWKDKVYRQLIEEFDIKEITWEQLLEDYIAQFQHSCVPFPHTIELLEKLQANDLALGMITNGMTRLQSSNIQALGIEPYFQVILISEQEGVRKPDPAIFNRALERLGIDPAQSVYVGDHLLNDVQGAQNAGMIGIWKKAHDTKGMRKADYIIEDLLDLEQVIKQLQAG